jgi:hypothetical protein
MAERQALALRRAACLARFRSASAALPSGLRFQQIEHNGSVRWLHTSRPHNGHVGQGGTVPASLARLRAVRTWAGSGISDGVVLSETLSGNLYRVVSVFGPYVSDDGWPDPGGYFVPCANNRIIVY